jgi:glycosyltransferase involved in cell wall biosynthesis
LKILFDHQKFSLQRYGGISRYFSGLNDGLNQQPGVSSRICVLYSENEYVKGYSFPFNNALGHRLFRHHRNRTIRWNTRYCRLKIKTGGFDIFHPTYYDTYFLDVLKKPLVITVHDMIHELFPELFPDAGHVIAQKKQLIEQANAIIAISHYTKADILKFFPHVISKISVVHHGYMQADTAPAKLNLPARYLLFVGERWHYKNFKFFAQAVAPLFKADEGLQLICAGGGPFSNDEQLHLQQLGIGQKCRQISASEAELKHLYQHALMFVFPSLQEGFGLPLLEAFGNNCPVVCSSTTSLPEVAGDAAVYFNPNDELSIVAAVSSVLYGETLRQSLVRAGEQRLKQFTLKKCITNTLEVYSSVL